VPRALRRERESAVLAEAVAIDEGGDVLARRALSGLASASDRIGTRVVERRGNSFAKLGEIGSSGVFVLHARYSTNR
jgi:hypothetical protein